MKYLENTVGIIPARTNSKRLGNKNFIDFCGKPLYAHTTDLASKILALSILSTNKRDLETSTLSSNIIVDQRKEGLCLDNTSMNEVIRHVIEKYNLIARDIVLLQPTSPLRKASDVINAYRLFKSRPCSQVVSISKANQSILKYGFLDNCRFTPIVSEKFLNMNDQALPDIFKPNGAIYIFKAEDFIKGGNKLPNSKLLGYLMPEAHSVDINTFEDLIEAKKNFT